MRKLGREFPFKNKTNAVAGDLHKEDALGRITLFRRHVTLEMYLYRFPKNFPVTIPRKRSMSGRLLIYRLRNFANLENFLETI